MAHPPSFHGALSSLTLLTASLALHTAAHAAPPENPAAVVMGSSAISGIQDNEIFQRDMPQNLASIAIKLVAPPSAATYSYYSISLLGANNARESVLAEGAYTGASLLNFTLAPQAAFRKIRVSFYKTASLVEGLRWDSPGLNAGEVFLVAGQSNAGNHGDTEGTPFTAQLKHRAIDPVGGVSWQPLQEPVPYTTSSGGQYYGSPWGSFADDLGARLGVPVAVLDVAWGGSAVEYWDSSVTAATTKVFDPNRNNAPVVLFDRLKLGAGFLKHLTATDGQLKCGFRAVLWHQGESNAERDFVADPNKPPPSRTWYAAKLKGVAQDFRNLTGCTQPWMVASATWLAPHVRVDDHLDPSTKGAAEAEIRAGQRYLGGRAAVSATEPEFRAGPDTDLLIGDDPRAPYLAPKAYRWDGIHMTRQGLTVHGQLWSARVAHMIDPVNHALETEKELSYEAKTVAGLYVSVLDRTSDEIERDREGIRYWVQTLTLNPGRATEAAIQSAFQGSDERFVRDTFQATLNRRPAWWEASYWVTELGARRTTRANLAAADRVAYENTLTPNGKKVFQLFVNVMGRTLPDIVGDPGGMNYWTGILNSNAASEAGIADSFRSSPEYRVRAAFVQSKGRQPSPAEINVFVAKLTPSTTDAWLANDVWVNAAN
ncbi:MAG: sialate O-acetylesterase [Pseudomonadota bacterium]